MLPHPLIRRCVQEERSLLRSGMLSGAEVNEIVARLHRVR